ncbi:hypothetical protein B5E80_14160 [Flavonifractor sp. An135]|nr:hypothetical protein [Flavonifractor sp. An135]OUQ22399.1 hypothetical protein B5E80_14160 [Flavonifractor sp. An135]
MPQLWCQPFYFLILCLGIYYVARSRRVFSEAWNKRNLESFFQEQCGQSLRREIGRGLLRTLFGDLPLFSWLMMFSMLRQGGAGCLFWYAVCMLLWLHPLGALSALWEYYRAPGEKQPDLGLLLERIRRRKDIEPRPRAVRGLHILHLLFLACLLPCISGAVSWDGLPLPRLDTSLVWAALAWAVCRVGGERMRRAAATLFLVFLGGALLWNLANLIPAIGLVLRDAFQLNRFLFALSGAGLEAAVRSGVQLGTGTFLLQGAAARAEEPAFPHPIHAAVYAQMRGTCQLVLQLAVGLLFLCSEMVPAENQIIQPVLYTFFCLFGLEFVFSNLRGLFRIGRRWEALACLGVLGALLVADGLSGSSLLLHVSWSVLWLMALSAAGLLMMDASWYFILLEQYRDVYLWHVAPHPRVSSHMKW